MRLAVLIGVIVLSACASDATGPDSASLLIHTDRLSYEAMYMGGTGYYTEYGFTVVAEFRNTTHRRLYLGRCFPDSPDPLWGVGLVDGGGDQSAYARPWACVGHDQQFRMDPGESRIDTLQVFGPTSRDGHTHEPYGVLEGLFRILYDVRLDAGDGAPGAPDSLRLSNTFRVTLAAEP